MLICGDNSTLTGISNPKCQLIISELQRSLFQKIYKSGSTLNEIILISTADGSTVNDVASSDFWSHASDGLFNKTNSEKVVFTPIFHTPTTEAAYSGIKKRYFFSGR